jgi:hypothetical protein
MDNDSLIRMYQGKEPKWKDPSATSKPQPQAKPQPKKYEAPAPSQKNNPEKDSLVTAYKKAFDEKYGVLNLKGQELENAEAMFKESWEAKEEGRPIRPRPGSPLDKRAREEGYGKLNFRRREPGEKPSYKIDDDQSPEARKRRMDALSGSLAKLAPAKK